MSKHRPQKIAEPAPIETSLTEDEAIVLAHGLATSAFDFIQARRASDTQRLTSGRFWFSLGQVMETDAGAEHVRALAAFVLAHQGCSADACYLFMGARLNAKKLLPWDELPLALRDAFIVFALTLPPLVGLAREDARRLKEQQRDAALALETLPNRGRLERIGARATNKLERIKGSYGG